MVSCCITSLTSTSHCSSGPGTSSNAVELLTFINVDTASMPAAELQLFKNVPHAVEYTAEYVLTEPFAVRELSGVSSAATSDPLAKFLGMQSLSLA